MSIKWYDIILSTTNSKPVRLQTGLHELHGVDSFDLSLGRTIENWNPDSCLRSKSPEDDGEADDVLCDHLGVPTFSRRLREALNEAGVAQNDIQYLPIRVFQSIGEEVPGFAIANVITRVEALDRKNSKLLSEDESIIDPLTGQPKVTGFWTPALFAEPLAGHDIIRLLDFFPPVLVSERFAEVFRRGKFTGVDLRPVPVSRG